MDRLHGLPHYARPSQVDLHNSSVSAEADAAIGREPDCV